MSFFFSIASLMIALFMLCIAVFFAAVVYALTCIGRMKMFQKAGVEGYKAWIPFYRSYVLCRICMGRGWYFILGYIPVISFFMRAVYALEVTLSYGQSPLFGILYFFSATIAELIAGFGGARYLGSQDLEQQVKDMFEGNIEKPHDGADGAQKSGKEEAEGSSAACSAPKAEDGGSPAASKERDIGVPEASKEQDTDTAKDSKGEDTDAPSA